MALRQILVSLMLAALLAGCGSRDDALDVALIDTEQTAFEEGLRLSPAAQQVRAASEAGLVAFNAQGEVVPALAETWLPTDDGLSYIFRLRDGTWPDGSRLDAQSAARSLEAAIDGLAGTSLARDLAVIGEVRAMAGRVIEIRLVAPEPYLLNLLAQPELALRHAGGGTGPMVVAREEERAQFIFKPPQERGLPQDEDWLEDVLPVNLFTVSDEAALAMFDQGAVDLVLGGDLGNLPLVETGPLSTGTLRVDSTVGLFGLQVLSDRGMLADQGVREAIAMAIDREALLGRYNIGGWDPTTRPVAPGLPGDAGLVAERWIDRAPEDRRAEASRRIAAWLAGPEAAEVEGGDPSRLTLYLGEGPGWDMLLRGLTRQLGNIGITLERATSRPRADLYVVDRIARYPAPRWFLNQFHCSLRRGLCSEELDAAMEAALAERDPAVRATLYAQAEAAFTLTNVYIPLGVPMRWSLVRGSVEGFEPNAYAFHPLPPMAERPR